MPYEDMFSRHSRMIAALYTFGDALLVLVSFWLAHYARAHFFPALRILYPAQFYLWIVPVILLIWIGVGLAAGIYREVREEGWRSILWDPVKVSLLSTLILFAFISAVKVEYISRLMIGLFALTDLAVMILFRLVARQLSGTLRRTFGSVVNFLIVGCTPEALEIAREIEANEAPGLKLAGFALVHALPPGDAGAEQPGLERRYPVYALAEMADLLRRHVIDEVIFAVSRDELEELEETFLLCEEEGVRTRVLVSFFPHLISRVSLERLRDMPLLTFSTTPENEFLLLLKRVVDFTMALVFLVVLSPVFLVLAFAIKVTSRGPILYRQTRCGLGGRRFTLYKFRSMRADADQGREALLPLNELDGPVFKIRDDPRRTAVGRFMRRFSLDELPQLFNILKGDMSFVGPRPPLPEEVERYERWQRRRLRMQPGLTCLWALEGRNRLNFRRWMELDLQYIDTWSPVLDWKILLKTIPAVLIGRGAS
jgi:exopolysaccharide biosynthesis polyprenyl glycosylphosphotransferase